MLRHAVLLLALTAAAPAVAATQTVKNCGSTIQYEGGGYLKSGNTYYFKNGQYLKSGNTLYYPNGSYLKSGSTYYYSSGSYLKSGSTFYYPSGNYVKTGSTYYYANGQYLKSSSTWYYSTGTRARSGTTLYLSNGASTNAPVTMHEPVGTVGLVSAWVDTNVERLALRLNRASLGSPAEVLEFLQEATPTFSGFTMTYRILTGRSNNEHIKLVVDVNGTTTCQVEKGHEVELFTFGKKGTATATVDARQNAVTVRDLLEAVVK